MNYITIRIIQIIYFKSILIFISINYHFTRISLIYFLINSFYINSNNYITYIEYQKSKIKLDYSNCQLLSKYNLNINAIKIFKTYLLLLASIIINMILLYKVDLLIKQINSILTLHYSFIFIYEIKNCRKILF